MRAAILTFALAVVQAAACSSANCDHTCPDTTGLYIDLAFPPEQLSNLTLVLCRSEDCQYGVFGAVPPVSNGPTALSLSNCGVAKWYRNPDGTTQLFIFPAWVPNPTTCDRVSFRWADGDVYALTLIDTAGTAVVERMHTVTSYAAGEACGDACTMFDVKF